MDTISTTSGTDDDPIGEARFARDRPKLFGDMGFDAAYATESHPEGLRYGEQARAPGLEPHRSPPTKAAGERIQGVISIG
ncbi:hypothetical protein OPU71_15645 [Niveibacterium sp. 24ML]|uniref:hypothetical protein n=1 Tax=Niveibacterium sp. 24ML TaxID=2985512 RepID=UPI0022716E23|nr:hypothetical protein [Niveibacterium sp. 24ML]MCX9157562.1 hypothetical protein [Niveibacterium sp. 24ML]